MLLSTAQFLGVMEARMNDLVHRFVAASKPPTTVKFAKTGVKFAAPADASKVFGPS